MITLLTLKIKLTSVQSSIHQLLLLKQVLTKELRLSSNTKLTYSISLFGLSVVMVGPTILVTAAQITSQLTKKTLTLWFSIQKFTPTLVVNLLNQAKQVLLLNSQLQVRRLQRRTQLLWLWLMATSMLLKSPQVQTQWQLSKPSKKLKATMVHPQ